MGKKLKKINLDPSPSVRYEALGEQGSGTRGRGSFPKCHSAALGESPPAHLSTLAYYPAVTYPKFYFFPCVKFSQKFKTFCLNSRATKFYPNVLASHLKLRMKLKHIKIIFKLQCKCELELLDFIWSLIE
jgi:hypothetical protein